LDSITEEKYQLLRKGGNFNLVVNNLKILSKIKKRGLIKPDIYLQFIISKYNEDEVVIMKKFSEKLGLKAEFRSISTSKKNLIPSKCDFRRNENQISPILKPINYCPSPWREMFISCDGKVTICCKSLDSKPFDEGKGPLVLGDLNKNKLEYIWNGQRYQNLRRQMLINKHKIGCPVRCPNPDFSLTAKIMGNRFKEQDNFYSF